MMTFNNFTILLVDDEEGIRNVLTIALKDMGFRVFDAGNGDKALAIFEVCKPGIVLTDIKMPGMDGIELLREIKKRNSDTEVIMMTGHGEMDLAIKSLKYEAIDFVTKPINDDILEIALKRATEKIAMRKALKDYTRNLEQLVKEKTDKLIDAERFSAIVETIADLSHSIKNIVGGLNGGAFILEQGIHQNDNKYILQGWEILKGNIDKIKDLSMNLLNYVKTPGIYPRLSHPNTPVEEIVKLMGPEADKMGINLTSYLSPDLGPFNYDPDAIHRCLLNLVSNAVDACRNDKCHGKERVITIQTLKTDGWAVEYRISDNCGGIDDEIRKNIFKGFVTSKGSKGSGVGLMMTKKLIDAHKGTIRLANENEPGTTFIVRLPH